MNASDISAALKKQPIGFACGVLCVIFAALLYFRSGKIDEYQAVYDEKSAEAAKVLANVRNSANLVEQMAEIKTMTTELDGRLVRAGQLAINLQYFYKLEAENDVKLADIRQNNVPKTTKGHFVGIPYTVGVQGGYKQVLAFLYRLEAGPHFCRFVTVNFAKNSSNNDVDGMSMSLSVELLGTP